MRWWFSLLSAIFALAAAVLWAFASFQKMKYVEELDEHGMIPATITQMKGDKRIDVLATAERQTRWNSFAALAASVSALSQAISLLIWG